MRQLLTHAAFVLVALLSVGIGLASAPASSAHAYVPANDWTCTGPPCIAVNYHTFSSGAAWGDYSEVLIKSPTCVTFTTCRSNQYALGNSVLLSQTFAVGSYFIAVTMAYPGPPDSNGNFSYLWSDWRPVDGTAGTGANEHFKGYPTSGDIGQFAGLEIEKAPGTGNYYIQILAPSGTLTGESTDNTMSTNETSMGLGVNGNKPPIESASSPVIQFVDNQQEENTGFTYYQSNGISKADPPADEEWVITPQSDPTHDGGEFQTACDCG